MSSVSRKINSRRRLAALTFLSNISLDGTHKDTNLGDLNFNLKLKNNNKCNNVTQKDSFAIPSVNTIQFESDVVSEDEDEKNIASIKLSSIKCRKLKRRQSEYQESFDHFYDNLQPKNKDRVYKFVSDTKARLCNLSFKRRLSHQKSLESYGLSTENSTESLVLGSCRSRKTSLCPSEASFPPAEVKFLKNLNEHKNEAERMVMVSSRKSPFILFSVLPFTKVQGSSKFDLKLEGSRRRHASTRQLSAINDGPDPFDLLSMLGLEKSEEGQDISYGELLAPTTYLKRKLHDPSTETESIFRFPFQVHSNEISKEQVFRNSIKASTPPKYSDKCADKEDYTWQTCSLANVQSYHPNLLDNPELVAGKHSTLLVFASYIMSIIDYVKPSDLKKELNDKFRERFPQVQLTLSKLRSLKREMYRIAKQECNIDLSTIAQAFVYFEKLILKLLVNKQNRKHCAGACLLLSAKLNDVRASDLKTLLEKIESIFRINRKDLVSSEFSVLVSLEFSLLLNVSEILPHYHRLLYES